MYRSSAWLPGTSRHVHFEDHSRDTTPDEFCNGAFDYDLTIDLLVYPIL
jgi:hypothetical protein